MTRLNKQAKLGSILIASIVALHVQAQVLIIDDEDAGYTTTGAWTREMSNFAYNKDEYYQSAPNNGATATWSFSSLPSGKYYLSASWVNTANRTTAANYTFSDAIPSVMIDQSLSQSYGFDASSNNVGYARLSNFNGYVPQLISDGTLSVTVSSAIASRYLMADSVRLERAPDDVEKVYVIDNEDAAGYSEIGTWATYDQGMDHRTNYRYNNTATQTTDTATFSFTGLEDGVYRISATWISGTTRPSDATYIIPGIGSRSVNQTEAPLDDTFEDSMWNVLFSSLPVSSGALSLVVTNPAGGAGYVLIADAIRLEKLDTAYDRSAFRLIENFEQHVFGSDPSSTNGWVKRSITSGLIVSNETGQAAQLLATGNAGYNKRLGANSIPDGQTGTLFFRMRSYAETNLNFAAYLTDWNWASGNWWDHDNAGIFSRSDLGDGSAVRPQWDAGPTTDIAVLTWYNVWVVANNSAKTFDLYISRNFSPATGGPSSMTVATGIPFQNSTTDLNYFMFLGTTITAGQGALIDDIYIAQGVNLQLPKPLGVSKGTMVSLY
jgi:hypothetical protein